MDDTMMHSGAREDLGVSRHMAQNFSPPTLRSIRTEYSTAPSQQGHDTQPQHSPTQQSFVR